MGVLLLPFLFLLPLASTLSAAPALGRDAVDWPSFLGRHDLIFEQLPRQWNEGAFAGNGNMGFVAYADLKANTLVFHLGRMDVTDHRKAPNDKTSMGTRGAGVMFDYPRLDVGRLLLRPAGQITGGAMRMDLWNAEITGVLTTNLGELRFRALTARHRMLDILEVHSTEKSPNGAPMAPSWSFEPGYASSPRVLTNPPAPLGYALNPVPSIEKLEDVPVCVTRLLAGGDFATAWLEKNSPGSSILYVSTANEVPQSGKSAALAVSEVQAAATHTLGDLLAEHRSWWQSYYRRSFLSIPEPRLESFYWIQMYKLAAALRPDGPALDVLGPFYRTTQWPGLWWNLNVQLSYGPVYAANRLDLGETFTRLMDQSFDGIFAGFRNRPTLGDFTWAMHNYWCQLRFAGDWAGLRQRWLPKAKQVFASYKTLLTADASGKLNLQPMGSPEYHGFATFPNTNYNLGLLRWLLAAMLECDARSAQSPDPESLQWKTTLEKLAPYPVDENGLRIAENQALDQSHRHYSHLLALYPLYQLNPDSAADRELVLKSVKHWHAIENGKALTGYSLTGAASLYASLGMGDEAANQLNLFLTAKAEKSILHSNTFYTELGGRNPVIETPLSAASATMDLLLQSWGGKVRIFPAVPTTWGDANFRDLRAMGGFLVSAARQNGATQWVAIRSEAGEPCQLKVPDWKGTLTVRSVRNVEAANVSPGEYRINLQKGEEALIFPKGANPQPVSQALPMAGDKANLYGVKRGGEIKADQFWPEPTPAP